MSYVDDMITGWLGVGTQLDSFAHLGIDYTFYNGNKAQDFVRTTGVTKLGVEGVPPMVTRGVLVDLAKFKGKPRLDGGELVTADELRQAMQAQNVRVTPGDVVVLHTGWLSMLAEDPKRFGDEEPGIDGAGAELLAGLQPCAVGADTWGVECVPFKDPNVLWQGHQVLLAQNGIHILENLDTSGPGARRGGGVHVRARPAALPGRGAGHHQSGRHTLTGAGAARTRPVGPRPLRAAMHLLLATEDRAADDLVHAHLPAAAGRLQRLQHVAVEPDGNETLGGRLLGAARPAPGVGGGDGRDRLRCRTRPGEVGFRPFGVVGIGGDAPLDRRLFLRGGRPELRPHSVPAPWCSPAEG